MSPSPDSPLDPGYVDPVIAERIRRMRLGRDAGAQLPGAAGPGFAAIQPDGQFQEPLPAGAMQPPQASGTMGMGTGQPQTRPSQARMAPPGSSPVAPQTGGPAPPPATGAAPTPAAPTARQAPPGVTNYAAQMAPLQARQAALTTPVGQDVPGQPGVQGERPVLQSKGVGGALQRVAMALLSATKFAPYAQQIVHPQFTQQLASNEAQLAGIQSQLGTIKEEAAAQEQTGRAAWYQQQAQEGKGRYLRVGNGVFDQELGQWTEQPTDKTNLVKIDRPTALARGLSPDKNGDFWVPGAVAAQIVKPIRGTGDTIEINPTEGARLGIQPDENGKYYLPKEGIGPYVTGKEKPATPPTAEANKLAYQGALAKMSGAGELPPNAATDAKSLATAISRSRVLTPDEKNNATAFLTANPTPSSAGSQATIRVEGFQLARVGTYIDTQTGQESTMNIEDFNKKNNAEPGRYVEAGKAIPVQKAGAVYRSLHQSIAQVRNALPALGTLDAGTRAKLANALKDPDPTSAIQEFIQGSLSGMTLTPQQEDAINAIRTLGEDALSLRQLVGMGQGSDTQRKAILNTLPSAISASPHMMQGQLDNLERLLGTLEGGLPGLGRAATASPRLGPGGPGGAPPPAAAKTVPRALVQQYANEHRIDYNAAQKIFTDKQYTVIQ